MRVYDFNILKVHMHVNLICIGSISLTLKKFYRDYDPDIVIRLILVMDQFLSLHYNWEHSGL